MIEQIISIVTNLWAPFAALAGGLLFILFQRWRIKKKNELIERQEQVIQAHEQIEEVHKQDTVTDQTTDQKIEELREKVENEEPQKGAQDIQAAINDYFSGDRK